MSSRLSMTLNLTAAEMAALDRLSAHKDLSKTAVLRQALKLYDAIDTRVGRGEKFYFEDAAAKEKVELVML